MNKVDDIDSLLRSIARGNNTSTLKVIRGKSGSLTWKESIGTVTIRLPTNRTYTISRQTYAKIEPYLV
jgi:hypothetical protein